MAEILNLPIDPVNSITPKECLKNAQALGLKDMLILGFDENDKAVLRASNMAVKDVLWLLEWAKTTLFEEMD